MSQPPVLELPPQSTAKAPAASDLRHSTSAMKTFPRAVRSIKLLSIGMLSISLLNGCGYAWSNNGNSFSPQMSKASNGIYRENIRTIAIPIFANKTYSRSLEFSLTKAVITELESHTPYHVAPKERADAILTGEIMNVSVHNISRSPFNALPQEQLFLIDVNFTLKDLRTGQIYVERRGFEQSAPYYPTLGEDQSAGAQDNIEKLALAIVEELEAPWGKTGKSD